MTTLKLKQLNAKGAKTKHVTSLNGKFSIAPTINVIWFADRDTSDEALHDVCATFKIVVNIFATAQATTYATKKDFSCSFDLNASVDLFYGRLMLAIKNFITDLVFDGMNQSNSLEINYDMNFMKELAK